MRVLVTGGAGFIGSHLVDRLLAEGHAVTVLDDLSTGRAENLAHLDGVAMLRFLRGSVLDEELVGRLVGEAELIFHLAAAVGVKHVVDDPLRTIRTNLRGTELVLERAAALGRRVLFASTSEIYGDSEEAPFQEDGPRVLGPTWVHRWAYATSKALDEHLCFAWAERGLSMSIVRYFNVFGPRMDPVGYGSVIARFLSQALVGEPLTVHGDGEQSRCFTYVTEAVDATLRAGTRREALGEALNIGSPFEHTINDLARRVVALTGSGSEILHVPYERAYGAGFADTRRRVPAVAKAAQLLGWRAGITLDEGLPLLLDERRDAR